MSDTKFKRVNEKLKKMEEGFNLTDIEHVKLKEYNALQDPNMKHYFENGHIQYHLYKTGQIDRNGRVVDLEKNKAKLFILEREFREAEKVEEKRQKEELEMRYRVQRKRFSELENQRKREILEKLKSERELSKEIVSTLKMASTAASSVSSTTTPIKKSALSNSASNKAFFITES